MKEHIESFLLSITTVYVFVRVCVCWVWWCNDWALVPFLKHFFFFFPFNQLQMLGVPISPDQSHLIKIPRSLWESAYWGSVSAQRVPFMERLLFDDLSHQDHLVDRHLPQLFEQVRMGVRLNTPSQAWLTKHRQKILAGTSFAAWKRKSIFGGRISEKVYFFF